MTPYPTFAALSAEWDAFSHAHPWAAMIIWMCVFFSYVGGFSAFFHRNRDSEIDQLKLDVIKLQVGQKYGEHR